MPNLGAAFGAGWEDYLTKQAATKHQAMLDEISRQHEIRLAQEGLDHHAESLAVQHQNELKLQEQIEQGKQKQIDGVMKDVLPDDALTDDTRQKLESIEQGLSARLFPKSAPEVVPGPTEDGFPLQQQDPRALFLGHAVDRKAIIQKQALSALSDTLAGMPNATRQEVYQAAARSGAVPVDKLDEFTKNYMEPKVTDEAPVKVTYRDASGKNVEKYVTRKQAIEMGVMQSPTPASIIVNANKEKETSDRVRVIGDGILGGKQLYDPEGLNRDKMFADVTKYLLEHGADTEMLRLHAVAVKAAARSLNNPQQTRIQQDLGQVDVSLDRVDFLADKWDSVRWGPLSRALLARAKEGELGQEAQSQAMLLEGAVVEVRSRLASIYQNGGAVTKESSERAETQMNQWAPSGVLHDLTEQGRFFTQAARYSMKHTQATVPAAPVPGEPGSGIKGDADSALTELQRRQAARAAAAAGKQ